MYLKLTLILAFNTALVCFAQTASLVKDVSLGPSNGTGPNIVPAGGSGGLYFIGNDGINGVELWKSDGTTDGTLMIKDIKASDGAAIYSTGELLGVDGSAYFAADDGTNGFEVWKSDGTPDGTVMLKDINPELGESSLPRFFTELNGKVIFRAQSPSHGIELWTTDGTPEGTTLLKDILPGPSGSVGQFLVKAGRRIFFTASLGTTGYAIWTTDGTTTGTVLVRDIYPAEEGPYFDLVASGDLLYFRGDTVGPSGPMRLWRSDGTPGGTFPIHTFTPTPTLAFKPWMTDVNGTLFFFRRDGLWKTNGTEQSTSLVKPLDRTEWINSTFVSSGPDGTLYFTVEGTSRDELWRSDGTDAGTVVVKEFAKPVVPSNRAVLLLLGEQAGTVFLSVQSADGYQLWRTRGTVDTTTAIPNLFLNPVTSVVSFGPDIYFAAETTETGRELRKAPFVPSISSGGVVDAAAFLPTLAPGSLASLFGVELAGASASAQSLPLPTALAGARIQVNGIDAPLLFVSPQQINFQVPFEVAAGEASVVALIGEQVSPGVAADVAAFAPRLFVNPANGLPIIQRHPDGALISAQNPAKPGDILILYVTGIGGLDNEPETGTPATGSPLSSATLAPTVTLGGIETSISFAGLTPGFVGLGQINIHLPSELPQVNALPLSVRFDSNTSQTLPLLMQAP